MNSGSYIEIHEIHQALSEQGLKGIPDTEGVTRGSREDGRDVEMSPEECFLPAEIDTLDTKQAYVIVVTWHPPHPSRWAGCPSWLAVRAHSFMQVHHVAISATLPRLGYVQPSVSTQEKAFFGTIRPCLTWRRP